MNDRPKIDPRYDPAFQRGFTGEVETEQRQQGAVRATQPSGQTETQTPAADSPPRRAEPLAGPSVPPAYAVAPADADSDGADVDDEVDVDETLARPLTRNPFLIVLALLGAALIVAGISWAITGRATMTDSGSLASERDYWYVQASLLGAPVTIAAGVLIIAGVLFMFAQAWNRATPKSTE
jgi:hypothetical protein